MMTSKDSFLALLVLAVTMAVFSAGLFFFAWIALAAAEAFVLGRWWRGRPCEGCRVRTRVRYLVMYSDHADALCSSCVVALPGMNDPPC